MKRIHLLRHAKSGHDDPARADHDRPLARRGKLACPLIADYFAAHYAAPDLVLCSTSRRTRDTLARLTDRLGATWPAVFETGLYLASPSGLLQRLRQLDGAVGSVLLIGHNPGMEILATSLGGDPVAAPRLPARFPTAALAVLDFDGDWPALAPGACRLIDFVTPRELAAYSTRSQV